MNFVVLCFNHQTLLSKLVNYVLFSFFCGVMHQLIFGGKMFLAIGVWQPYLLAILNFG
jgi:hypothetical protein